nr:hypothetical protein [Tanacetum cinerariifolium]
ICGIYYISGFYWTNEDRTVVLVFGVVLVTEEEPILKHGGQNGTNIDDRGESRKNKDFWVNQDYRENGNSSRWSQAKTINEDVRLQALVDRYKVIVNEASIRRDLRLDDVEGFSGAITPLFETMMVQAPEAVGQIPTNTQDTPILTQPSSSQPQRKHKSRRKQRKETEISQDEPPTEEHIPTPSYDLLPSGEDRLKLNELIEICTKLFDRVLSLEQTKTNQAAKIEKLKKRVKKLEGKKKKRTHELKRMYKEISTASGEVVTTTEDVKVTTAAATLQISKDDVTLAQTLIEIKAAKPKRRYSSRANTIWGTTTPVRDDSSSSSVEIYDTSGYVYERFIQVFVNHQLDDMSHHKKIFVTPSLTKKVFANIKREENGFSGIITPLFETMMVQAPEEVGEEEAKIKGETEVPHTEPQTEESVPTTSNDPIPSGKDRMELTELMNLCTNLQKQVLDLEKAKTAQAKQIADLKNRVKKLERKKKLRTSGRMIDNIDQDEEIALVDETQGRMNEKEMFGVNDLDGDEVIVDATAGEEVEQSTKVAENETLIEIKAAKPKARRAIVQEPSEFRTTSSSQPSQLPKARDKEIVDERSKKTQAQVTEGGSKRAGDELEQESAKRQRLEKEDDSAKLKRCLEIVPEDDDDVTIKATPLSLKSPTIVDYKIYKEGKKSYVKIIRADGNS